MAYDPSKPFTYGIPDGTYVGRPTTASCFEKDGRLILDVNFAVKDPKSGQWYMKDNGYAWEAKKRHWLTSKDGGFNEATINGIREWAKGWQPRSFDDFWWFQSPDANGTPFGNLKAVGEVELKFTTGRDGSQSLWVNDPNRASGSGRRAFVPEGAVTDAAQIRAKWGSKANAMFAATPKKVTAANTTAAATQTATPAAAPQTPARHANPPSPAHSTEAKPKAWADYPRTVDGAFGYFCSKLKEFGEEYSGEKHDELWFRLFDEAARGKDADLLMPNEIEGIFEVIEKEFSK